MTVRIWNVNTGKCERVLKGHDHWVHAVAYSPDGKLVASCGDDRTVRIWDVQTGRCKQRIRAHRDTVWEVAFSRDGKVVASAADDRLVKLWHVKNGWRLMTLRGHNSKIFSLEFSPDDKLLATGAETLRVWDALSCELERTIASPLGRVYQMRFLPESKVLACACTDGILFVNASTGVVLRSLPAVQPRIVRGGEWVNYGLYCSVAIAPDGMSFASVVRNGHVVIWSVPEE
jgi:WD40 repeat protein